MYLLDSYAVSMNLSCSTATLITQRLRASHASDRCLVFKDWNARIIANCAHHS